jgi:hypothetical protein
MLAATVCVMEFVREATPRDYFGAAPQNIFNIDTRDRKSTETNGDAAARYTPSIYSVVVHLSLGLEKQL